MTDFKMEPGLVWGGDWRSLAQGAVVADLEMELSMLSAKHDKTVGIITKLLGILERHMTTDKVTQEELQQLRRDLLG